MKNKINNSCNGRGCKIRIILPNNGKLINASDEVYGKRYDIQKILPTVNTFSYKIVEKKR
jgi:hypothetical protein